MIIKPSPFNGDYKRDPNIRDLKRTGFMNYGPTLGFKVYLPKKPKCMVTSINLAVPAYKDHFGIA